MGILRWKVQRELQRADEQHRAHGIQTLVLGSPDYPRRLAEIPDPPPVLYVKGQLREEPRCLAVVGTRNPSPDGLLMAEYWVHELALAQPCIVSGLALGIDAAAHEEALRSGLTTWAVLAHGLETAHPGRNARLAERILLEGGAWISEWPFGTPPRAEFFPRRNRIISGLSRAVVRRSLMTLQHLGYVIPPQADAGWIGEAGPGLAHGQVGTIRPGLLDTPGDVLIHGMGHQQTGKATGTQLLGGNDLRLGIVQGQNHRIDLRHFEVLPEQDRCVWLANKYL